jgi:hydroxymethylpyrimidine kinase/phosphomethylpyrimidine kinase/thiamine-phosphate diphosphorylase
MAMHQDTVVWTIAGSDSGGGAGLQADLKTFFDLGVHGCSVVTAITAQNSIAVLHSQPVSETDLNAQLTALADDLPARAIKVGQLPTAGHIAAVHRFLEGYEGFVVYDPVLRASTGFELGDAEVAARIHSLYPFLSLLTPNRPEAEQLTGMKIHSSEDVVEAARRMIADGLSAVLLKGGHAQSDWCQDYFSDGKQSYWLSHRRSGSSHTHGTGCMLSAAIAAFIAQGKALRDAIVLAHAYVQQGIRLAVPLGRGAGPVVQAGWPDSLGDYPEVSDAAEQYDLPAFASCGTDHLGLYPIVDSIEWLHKLLPAGVKTIQLRIKDQSAEYMDSIVADAVGLGREYAAGVFINDYWELAIEHRAYGVHLGQEDIGNADLQAIREAGLRLGISTHSEFEWARAATVKPSYIALGTVYPTNTKPAILIGTGNLCRWVPILQSRFPLTAIGGIKLDNIDSVLASGIRSVAVATAITEAEDYLGATRSLLAAIS